MVFLDKMNQNHFEGPACSALISGTISLFDLFLSELGNQPAPLL